MMRIVCPGSSDFQGWFFKVVLFFLCLIVTHSISAQDSTRIAVDARADSMQQLMELMLPDSSLASMVDIVFEQMALSFPNLSGEEMGRIREEIDLESLKARLYAVYGSSYSPDEVSELLEFYATPLGKKMLVTDLLVWKASWIEGVAMVKRAIEKTIAGKVHPEVRWVAFIPDDSSFAVLMPGEPTEMIIPTRIPSGIVDAHQFMTTSTYCAYMASVADSVPGGDGDESEAILKSVAGTLIQRVGGELVSDVPFVGAFGPGRELTIMLADGDGVYRVRLFVNGEHLYQLTAVTPISEYYTSQAVHFLDSFELISQ